MPEIKKSRGRPPKLIVDDEVFESLKKAEKLTPPQIEVMSFKQLRELAKLRGIVIVGKTKKDLQMELGAAPAYSTNVNLGETLTAEQINDRKEKGQRIPGNVRYWDKDEDKLWKVWEKNPEAFDGIDFTDENSPIHFTFEKKFKCYCGEEMLMWRRYRVKETTTDGEIIFRWIDDRESMSLNQFEKYCPKCGRKWIYINPDKIPEVAK